MAPGVDALVVRVKGNAPASVALLGKHHVEMDLNPRTTTVLDVRDMRHAAQGEQARHVLDEIYFGQYDGWPIKALYALLGLMPGLLSATGFVLWKKKPACKPAGARPAAAGTSRPIRTRPVLAITGAAEAGSH